MASCVVVKSASDSSAPLVGDNEKPIIRPYTPVSSSDVEGELHFLIKRYESGKMSNHIHGLKPGESLAIKGPITKIPYEGGFHVHNCALNVLRHVRFQLTSGRRLA